MSIIDDGALVLMVRGGPLAFQKKTVRPGGVLTVGRTDRAALVVPHDKHLVAVHFSIAWQEGKFWLIAESSPSGVQLNGQQIQRTELSHKDWIHAGGSDFTVASQAEVLGDEEPSLEGPLAEAFDLLNDLRAPLFAVLDASRGERVLDIIHAADERCASLYDGVRAESLADVAPYLIELPRTTGLLAQLIAEGWGEKWGIYVQSRRPFVELRRHLRRFLMVEDDDTSEKMYFRFYDPSVLREFLAVSTERERTSFFGEIERIYVEGEQSQALLLEAQGQIQC